MQKPKEHNNVAFFWKECLHNHAGMPLLIGLMLKQSKLQLTFLLYLQTTCCWQTLRNMVCPSAGLEHPHNPYLPSDLTHKQLVADKAWGIWCARVLGWSRVGHSVLFRAVRYVLFLSKKRMFHSFLFVEFLATYETQKNVPFFCIELKRTQRTLRSFAKNGKNVLFFFLDIYRNIYRCI